jgi:NADH dehydrogenase (ubiquinone) Fe-S protein 1
MGEHGRPVSSRSCRCPPTGRFPRGLEDYSVCCYFRSTVIYAHFLSSSALSEVLSSPLPYDDILSLRDRMWDISPTLVCYDVAERTSPEVAVAGLQTIVANTASAKVSGKPFLKPISNFYQTDPISRALVFLFYLFLHSGSRVAGRSVTMAQCTRAFVKGEDYGLSEKGSEAAYA